jgi:heat shock protein HslJ
MKGQNYVSEDEQQLINHGESTSASSKSASKQNSESDRIQQQVEVHLDMEPETVASRSESLNFDTRTGEIFANGINEIHGNQYKITSSNFTF